MSKKRLILIITLCCLFGGAYFFKSNRTLEAPDKEVCAFCNPAVLNAQKFYEDDLVFALYTHKPIVPGHFLILPRRHVERFELLTDEEIMRMGQVIKKVNHAARQVFNISSYLLLQKNGREVGQSVPHVHIHYIPRETGDDSTLKFLIQMYVANMQQPISPADMHEVVEKMKVAMHLL